VVTIKATCGTCGDVVLGVPDVDVHACSSSSSAWYSFLCPVCEEPVIKEASPAAVTALLRAGCASREWGEPADLPPISPREVADFRRALRKLTDSSMIAGLADS
jgi:hypothetical protein